MKGCGARALKSRVCRDTPRRTGMCDSCRSRRAGKVDCRHGAPTLRMKPALAMLVMHPGRLHAAGEKRLKVSPLAAKDCLSAPLMSPAYTMDVSLASSRVGSADKRTRAHLPCRLPRERGVVKRVDERRFARVGTPQQTMSRSTVALFLSSPGNPRGAQIEQQKCPHNANIAGAFIR